MNTVEIETKLSEKLAELQQRRDRIGRHTRHREEPLPADSAEQAIELENQGTLVALDKELSAEIAQIKRAIARLREGLYSECEVCGNAIGKARLEALPYTSFCIDCAA